MQLKICADCGEERPITAYSVKDRRRGYLNKYCKPCDSQHSIARQAGRTAERVAYNRRWRAENPDKVREYNKRGGKRYRERHPEYWHQYYLANRERRIQNLREWRERNRERYLTAEADRRLRKRLQCRPDDLLTLIEAVLPNTLPQVLREDARQELALSVLSGEITVASLRFEARRVMLQLSHIHMNKVLR